MKKLLVPIVVSILFLASAACAQDLRQVGLPGLASLLKDLAVNPYVQVGFQRVGSNMNLPVGAEAPTPGLLQIEEMDISLKDANFWTGTAGVSIKKGELLSLFGSVGGSLKRTFIVSGEIPVSLGATGGQPTVDFDASQLGMWYAQGGVSLGPILLGLYGDHFGIEVGEPRIGSVPSANQTLRGDVITTTLAPYIGFAIPASNGLLTVIYSPLASSATTLVLRTSQSDLAQAQYKWNKPGNFLSCSFQYNATPIDDFSFGLWSNYTYMDVHGNAQLDFQNSTTGVSRQKEVTATMTKYILQGGVMLGMTF
jgi:hypothetical protein